MPPEEDRATVIGNMRTKLSEVWLCSFWDMRVDRQTDMHITTLLRAKWLSQEMNSSPVCEGNPAGNQELVIMTQSDTDFV